MRKLRKSSQRKGAMAMPFKSKAQEKYFFANRSKLEKQGVNVKEWVKASEGKVLPMKAPKKQTEDQQFIKALKGRR